MRPGIIDARARYRAAARSLKNTTLGCPQVGMLYVCGGGGVWRVGVVCGISETM